MDTCGGGEVTIREVRAKSRRVAGDERSNFEECVTFKRNLKRPRQNETEERNFPLRLPQ